MIQTRSVFVLVSMLVACNSGGRAPSDATNANTAATAASSGSQPTGSQAFSSDSLQGIWYACDAIGGGFCDRIVLAAGGRYERRASQSSCERIVLRRGQWRVEGATLILEEASHVEIDGGTCATTDTGARWSGATIHDRVVEARSMERLALASCSDSERNQSEATCVRMGDAPRWKLSGGESMDASPMPTLQ